MNRVPFRDVKSTDWSFNAIRDSVSNKMILGYNSTKFAPNEKNDKRNDSNNIT